MVVEKRLLAIKHDVDAGSEATGMLTCFLTCQLSTAMANRWPAGDERTENCSRCTPDEKRILCARIHPLWPRYCPNSCDAVMDATVNTVGPPASRRTSATTALPSNSVAGCVALESTRMSTVNTEPAMASMSRYRTETLPLDDSEEEASAGGDSRYAKFRPLAGKMAGPEPSELTTLRTDAKPAGCAEKASRDPDSKVSLTHRKLVAVLEGVRVPVGVCDDEGEGLPVWDADGVPVDEPLAV